MYNRSNQKRMFRSYMAAVAIGAIGLGLTLLPATSRAMELIPSLGIAKSTDDNAGDAKVYGGLALRAPLLPILSAELGVAYRQESFFDDNLHVRTWPVTASLWINPLPVLYVGGGFGWYETTFDYPDGFILKDRTAQQTGMHLGGGLDIPVGPHVGLDLNGRYVFMKKQDSPFPPQEWNPDFWTTTVGLALKF